MVICPLSSFNFVISFKFWGRVEYNTPVCQKKTSNCLTLLRSTLQGRCLTCAIMRWTWPWTCSPWTWSCWRWRRSCRPWPCRRRKGTRSWRLWCCVLPVASPQYLCQSSTVPRGTLSAPHATEGHHLGALSARARWGGPCLCSPRRWSPAWSSLARIRGAVPRWSSRRWTTTRPTAPPGWSVVQWVGVQSDCR